MQLYLRTKVVFQKGCAGLGGGWRGRGGREGGSEGLGVGGCAGGLVLLDALAALHLWFVLSGLHLDGHNVVAR